MELSKQRPIAEYLSPIPLPDIILYLQIFYGEFELDYRVGLITNLDSQFIHNRNKERKEKANARS